MCKILWKIRRSPVSKIYVLATPVDIITRLYSRKSVGLYSIFINRKNFLYRRTENFKAINKIPCHTEVDPRNWVGAMNKISYHKETDPRTWVPLAYESIWLIVSTLERDNVHIRIIFLRVKGNIKSERTEVRNND